MSAHFLDTASWSWEQLQALLGHARQLRENPMQPLLAGKSIALIFFNPSLRTRASFEVGAWQMGAKALVLEPGRGAWAMAFGDGEVMDGEADEHVREAARVLSSYCDAIAVRAFPKFVDWQLDRQDLVIRAFAEHASVPVINMETITHPCQELAHLLALQDWFGTDDLRGRQYLLSWVWHPRPLNTAVANSALRIASRAGMHLRLLCPDERWIPDHRYMDEARANAEANGGSLRIMHDIDAAYDGTDVVYAKSWGCLPLYGDARAQMDAAAPHLNFMVDEDKMARTNGAAFSHCLPARRNVKASDAVMDAPYSLVIPEAENRLHVQKAVMAQLCGGRE